MSGIVPEHQPVRTLHTALLRANAVGTTATLRSASAAGRVVPSYEDRVAGYRASGEVLAREGWAHVHEGPGVWGVKK